MSPSDAPRFLCDAMLGKLCKWLRIAGFDAAYVRRSVPSQIVDKARWEGRIILTRNTRLASRENLPPHLFLAPDRWEAQLVEVARAFDLDLEDEAFARCLTCNVPLEPVGSRAEVEAVVPEYVYRRVATFHGCPACGKIFWAGSHLGRMEQRLRAVAQRVAALKETPGPVGDP
ncbi:MAG: Mut7-C RNAse domain-containing protein [Candidatus Tectimicrobiota bacterium]